MKESFADWQRTAPITDVILKWMEENELTLKELSKETGIKINVLEFVMKGYRNFTITQEEVVRNFLVGK